MGVRVVTDSACDLPQALAEELDIRIVPLSIRFGDEEFVDREELSASDFYKKMASSSAFPETAAPSPGAFEAAFRGAGEDGADGVLCINLSSDLSATFQSAQNAARAVGDDLPVRVVDSKSITMGLGMMCILAGRAVRDGASLDDAAALVEDLVPRTRVYGALDTLDNLKKGGRIGGAQALVGSLLSIKPIIDISTGKVEQESKQRTRAKALRYLAQKVAEHGHVENLAALHGGATDFEDLLDLLAEHYPRDEILTGEIGATIGTHGGAGVVGVTFHVAK
jgi:DegV family protein with EDD domain